jgi:hypothetical protein
VAPSATEQKWVSGWCGRASVPDVTAQESPQHQVRQVIAHIDLESEADKRAKVQRFRDSDWSQKPDELARIEQSILDPTKYQMTVTLTAVLADGRRLTSGGFGLGDLVPIPRPAAAR